VLEPQEFSCARLPGHAAAEQIDEGEHPLSLLAWKAGIIEDRQPATLGAYLG